MDKAEDVIIGGIPLSEENYLSLRKAYNKAISEGKTEFTFQNNDILVDFARYVLECMETYAIIKPLVNEDD